MKTFRTPLQKGFKEIGLNPEIYNGRNTDLFSECKQVRLTKVGLEGYVPDISDIMDPIRTFRDSVTDNLITITRRWPFPQVFVTDVGVFLGALEGLYRIIDPSPTRYPVIILYAYGTGATVFPWTCLPINTYPAFISGSVMLYYDSNASAYIVVT